MPQQPQREQVQLPKLQFRQWLHSEQYRWAVQLCLMRLKRRETQMKYFKRMSLSLFTGQCTAVEAGDWFRAVKKIFDTMGITSEVDRVILATFQLRSEVD